ncbi:MULTISPECIES: HAMP domain-containing sensor histidine kinase [unclassified Streptomyces]|uniref:sensor histidine kinase n=1 Tax=unclassified Streptomyces TaxID=2593676 RepID=UPI0022539A76|nr:MULTISPECIES: HAMP domain-containing sensor histidine kinase [unclassified Streptomyces]MCX4528068.1 HAMP domain-containing histidine kinase [Streptomyces sp. NBC_01551]MCX4541317.1 HAMP domain-containing histidine kinase [Streptomyces sp. NBC_01565]
MRLRRPAWTASLTWKSACFIVLMCCSLAAVLGVLVHVEVTRQTVASARDKALEKLHDASRAYEAGEALPPDAGVDPAGLPKSLRELALSGRRGTIVADRDGTPTMWAAAPADGRVLATAVDYGQSARTITGLDNAIIGSSVLAIGGTLLVGAFAVTRVTRRLHQTATVARRITRGDLDARVGAARSRPSRHQDEVATVARALDTMAGTLQAKLVSEQRFTADVAHELRTPLTGLQAASELLPEGRATELVRERVRTMRGLTEDLLEISRLDSGSGVVETDLHRLGRVAERVVRASGTDTEVVVVRDVHVETDRRRLERVLGNLVANAHRHGRGPVVVTVDGPVLTVRDHGDGYPDYLLTHGPQRFRSAGTGKGHGLGLTIAAGQAEAIGASLTFRNTGPCGGDAGPEGGAEATLALPWPLGEPGGA